MPTLTSKCQTTIPKEIREHLKIGPGDHVRWFVGHNGIAYILPEVSITSLKGILKGRRKRLELSEIDDAAGQGAVQRYKGASVKR
jgi:antitoxin PrlF